MRAPIETMLESFLREVDERDWAVEPVEGTVRLALVGTGWWTIEEAIPAIAATEHCEATVAVDLDADARDRAADVADLRAISPDEYARGVASDEYDAVYVATPNGTHLELVEVAAEHGKAVLCEKPMEASVERARALVDACERAGVELMVAYRMQTEPLVRRARELLADGVVGEPVQIHGDISATLLDIIPDHDQWRLDPEMAGGCTLIDLGIYPLNTIRFLLDEDPDTVSSATRSDHPAFADVEEHVRFALEFPGGVDAVCTASHNAYGTSDLRLVGTEGLIELTEIFHPWADRGLVVEVDGNRSTVTTEGVNQMTEEFAYFAHCLLADETPAPDGTHGLRDMQLIEAIYEADRTGERIGVPAPGTD